MGVPYAVKSNADRDSAKLCDRGNVWHVPYEPAPYMPDSAGRPKTFPRQLAKMYICFAAQKPGAVLLDPSTSARDEGVHYVGYEICKKWPEVACKNLNK